MRYAEVQTTLGATPVSQEQETEVSKLNNRINLEVYFLVWWICCNNETVKTVLSSAVQPASGADHAHFQVLFLLVVPFLKQEAAFCFLYSFNSGF